MTHPRLHALAAPDRPAVTMTDGSPGLTYGELESQANRGAQLIRSLGIGRGETIAYDALFLANGGRARMLPVRALADRILAGGDLDSRELISRTRRGNPGRALEPADCRFGIGVSATAL